MFQPFENWQRKGPRKGREWKRSVSQTGRSSYKTALNPFADDLPNLDYKFITNWIKSNTNVAAS